MDMVMPFVLVGGFRCESCPWAGDLRSADRYGAGEDRPGRELPGLDAALAACPDPSARDALEIPAGEPFVDRCEDVHRVLSSALVDDPPPRASDGGIFRDGHDAELDEARTLTREVELHGERMQEGDKVLVLLGSANRDERVWDRPDVFDLDRPTRGLIRVPDKPLTALRAEMKLPPAAHGPAG